MKLKLNKILAGCAVLASVAFMGGAHAAGTLAGTTVNNQANLNFSIGSVAQTPIASNTVSFVVDNKVNMTLVEDQGAATIGTPGGTGFVYKFKLTNTGNTVQDYALQVTQRTNGTTLFGKTDNFDASCTIVSDGNNDGIYQAANDTANYVDELAPDASREVFVLCGAPISQVNNDFAVFTAFATARAGGAAGTQGAALTQTTGANTAGVDIVFADGASNADESSRDGVVSARGALLIQAATLSVTKTATPICDPVNFNNNPKNIPGAYVRYTITVANAAGAGSSATLGNLTDAIDTTNLTFDQNLGVAAASSCTAAESAVGKSFKVTCVGGTRACVATPDYRTFAAGDDGYDYTSGTVNAGLNFSLPVETGYTAGELKAGESVKLEFNVIVK